MIIDPHNYRRLQKQYYDASIAEKGTIQQRMEEANNSKSTIALKKVKDLCKVFGFTAGVFKGSLTEGNKKL